MRKRVFPLLLQSGASWKNYSNYLNWIDTGVKSLKNYLNYFNPNFYILNADLTAILSNTKEEVTIDGNKTISGEFKRTFIINDVETTIIWPHFLTYRQGYFNQDLNTYICYDYDFISDFDEVKNDANKLKDFLDQCIKNQIILYLPPASVIFSKQWTHSGYQSPKNWDLQLPSSFNIISQPASALYRPSSVSNKLVFSFVEDGQRVLGTNLLFTLELSPRRYFLTDQRRAKWNDSSTSWSEEGAYWKNQNAEMEAHIINNAGQVWTNSYPIMHELVCTYKRADGYFWQEEFICDNNFNVEQVNIANHATMLYNINTTNITAKETARWNSFVSVQIL